MDTTENGSPSPLLGKDFSNEIFIAVEKGGLDLSGLDMDDSGTLFRIKHKICRSYFTVSGTFGNHVVCYAVGDRPEMNSTAYLWGQVTDLANLWARQAKLYLDTPDLWAELRRQTNLLGAVSGSVTDNTQFTPDEQTRIAVLLQGLAEEIRQQFSLTEGQIKALDEKIVYLVESAGRFGRKDWINILFGVLLTYALAVAIPPESIRAVAAMALRAIGLLYPELPSDT
jgi:hypothetical protein